MKRVFLTNPFTKEESPALKEEFHDRLNSLNEFGPVVPGSMYLHPNKDILINDNLKQWFPFLDDGISFEDLTPSTL